MQKFIPTNYKSPLNRFYCHPFVWYRIDAGPMDIDGKAFVDAFTVVMLGMFGSIGLGSIHILLGFGFLGLLTLYFIAKWVFWGGGHIRHSSDRIRTVWDNLNTLNKIKALKKDEASAIWDKFVNGDSHTQDRLMARVATLLDEYDLTHGTAITPQGAIKVLDDKISERQTVRGIVEELQ